MGIYCTLPIYGIYGYKIRPRACRGLEYDYSINKEYLVAKIGLDTGENEPSKVSQLYGVLSGRVGWYDVRLDA